MYFCLISDGDIEFAFDEKKKTVAFVQENELWTYRINGGRMTRVFGFPQDEDMDYRDFYDQNNIKVLRVEETGDVWFVVTGYMNRDGVRARMAWRSIIMKMRLQR